MASGPWRCSQCGTVNEPVANSCRTCGKWPSLFDLEESVVDEGEAAQSEPNAPETFEPRTFEPETFEQPPPTPPPDVFDAEPVESAEPEAEESRGPRWVRAIIPIAVLVYFAISFFFNER